MATGCKHIATVWSRQRHMRGAIIHGWSRSSSGAWEGTQGTEHGHACVRLPFPRRRNWHVVPAELTSERQNWPHTRYTHLRGVSAVSLSEVPNAPLPLRGGSTSHAGLAVRCLPTTATLDEAMFTACTMHFTAASALELNFHPHCSSGYVDG